MLSIMVNSSLILSKCYLVGKFFNYYHKIVSDIKNKVNTYFNNKPEKGLVENNIFLLGEHLFFSCLGLSFFWKEDWFYDITMMWEPYLNIKIIVYYLLYITRYIVQIQMLTGKEKDYNSMLLHHLSTISLLVLSFFHYQRIGTIIAFIHDLGDLFFLPSKIFHKFYITRRIYLFNIISYLFFSCFFVIFFITRIFCNSKIILYLCTQCFYPKGKFLLYNPKIYFEFYILTVLLFVNLSLQIFWELMIVKFSYNLAIGGKPTDEKGNEY